MSSRKLDDTELLERGQEMARLHARIVALEEEKKDQNRTLGDTLKGLKKRLAAVASEVRTGTVLEDEQGGLFAHEGGAGEDDEDEATG